MPTIYARGINFGDLPQDLEIIFPKRADLLILTDQN